MVEYYTGQDASRLTDDQLAMKVAHIIKLRELEAEESVGKNLQAFLR